MRINKADRHTFHIPVLGLSYSIDTPIKVARFGISSVVSIIEDELVEKMRAYHALRNGEEYTPITVKEDDFRGKRITAYLNLLNKIVNRQVAELRTQPFLPGNDIVQYFEMLPEVSHIKQRYLEMKKLEDGAQKTTLQEQLRQLITAGSIDVNIMSKVDKLGYDADGNLLPPEYADAMSALRGFANSDLSSSVVFSAGYNPRLYNYIESFKDFLPDSNGQLKKKVILKVSDYRSAMIQGKLLAKKGVWVSEFRIESGLNCGGHAFPTEGMLLGPILEEFKQKRSGLEQELYSLCQTALLTKGMGFKSQPSLSVTVQGGIGTANENEFLMEYYGMDGTGWGSPFLLVPDVTNVEEYTLQQLATAKKEDYFLSNASPLGVPFNNFRKSTAEQQRMERIEKNRPGSPCYKKFLATDTEFTEEPICTASRQYQNLKIKQLEEKHLPDEQYRAELSSITEKDCLCEGLGVSVLLKDKIPVPHKLTAVTICPGPNLAYFSGIFSLGQMVGHIYGRMNLLNSLPRPNMFVNEAQLYIDYLKKTVEKSMNNVNAKQAKYLDSFKTNLQEGIEYYKSLVPAFKKETRQYIDTFLAQLTEQQMVLAGLYIPHAGDVLAV